VKAKNNGLVLLRWIMRTLVTSEQLKKILEGMVKILQTKLEDLHII
jgi:hypothetical protein